MSEVVKLKSLPEPILYKGRERYLGWNTARVGQLLVEKKMGEQYTSINELARIFYQRDIEPYRTKVRNNTRAVRRWLSTRNEFLLIRKDKMRRIEALKVCNPSDENDRRLAMEHLLRLEATEEITHAEFVKWAQMLRLTPPEKGSGESVSEVD